MEDNTATTVTTPSIHVATPTQAPQPVPQTPPPQQPPQAPEPATSSKKPFINTLLIISIIIVLGAAGIFVLKNNKSSTPKTTNQSSGKTGSLGPKPKQVGLTSYTNNESKFSLQYPEELQAKENNVGMGVSTVELRSEENLDEDYVADIQMLTMPKYLAKAVGQDFDEYYNMSDNTSKTITAEDQSRVITKVKNRTINNQRAFEFKSTDGASDADDVTIGVYIEIGDKMLIISTQEDNRAELEKMLENFSYIP